MKKVVTGGEILVEVTAPEIGQTFLQPELCAGPRPLGAPAIFISQVGRLSQLCGRVARVGVDHFGKLSAGRLRDNGVGSTI
jgi:hypothetical protein